MKKLIVIACVGLIGTLCLAVGIRRAPVPGSGRNEGPVARPMGRLVVHEWGTFTGFAGSDGVHLPFRTNFGSDLPGFVVNRQQQAFRQDPKRNVGLLFLKGGGAAALQRMETPVVYFYADSPGEVNVRVDFPEGSLTEFYPPVRNMGPAYGLGFGESSLANGPQTRPAESFLDWGNVRIVPHPTASDGKHIPAITEGGHYALARNTDSALVQFADTDGTRHEEKFLFYRGLGNFTLPLTLAALGGDRFELRYVGTAPITSAFLIQINADAGKTPRFARFRNIAGTRQMSLPAAAATQDQLFDAIAKSLVADGLYEKEARAMVATWKSTWLDEPGTRLLYLVPRPVTDGLLPLHVIPTPDQMVRVLVGRIDVLTPEREARLRSIMQTADKGGNLTEEEVGLVTSLGRFTTPALDRIGKLAGDIDHGQVRKLYEALSRPRAAGK